MRRNEKDLGSPLQPVLFGFVLGPRLALLRTYSCPALKNQTAGGYVGCWDRVQAGCIQGKFFTHCLAPASCSRTLAGPMAQPTWGLWVEGVPLRVVNALYVSGVLEFQAERLKAGGLRGPWILAPTLLGTDMTTTVQEIERDGGAWVAPNC